VLRYIVIKCLVVHIVGAVTLHASTLKYRLYKQEVISSFVTYLYAIQYPHTGIWKIKALFLLNTVGSLFKQMDFLSYKFDFCQLILDSGMAEQFADNLVARIRLEREALLKKEIEMKLRRKIDPDENFTITLS
jgi:hypothetical protein